jgi:hypothetical protein
LQRIKDREEKL